MERGEQKRLLDDVEAFCQEIRPVEELCYVEQRFNDQVLPLARKHNLLGMPVPKEYGGRDADAVTYALALARIGREGTGVRTFFSGHTSIGQAPILYWGNPDQKRRYLPASVKGEKVLAFGLTEPEAGSNPLEMQMTYERRGDQFILNGVKYLISNGGIADAIITFAYPKPPPTPPSQGGAKKEASQGGAKQEVSQRGAKKEASQGEAKPEASQGGTKKDGSQAGTSKRRISAFIVDTNGPGFNKEDLHAKMGMPTANTAMFELADCAVPAANLLGEEGNGFRIAMTTLITGRMSVAAGCLGVIEDCLIEAANYAKEREQHGKAIAKHQLVQEHIAAIEMHRATTEAIVMKAAEAKDAADADPGNAALRGKSELLAAQAKLHAANAAWDAADRAVQVFGGRGWSDLYRPGRHLKDVRVCRIYEGTDEILKLKIAAAVLGKEYEAYK